MGFMPTEELSNERFAQILHHLRFYKGWNYNQIRDYMKASHGWEHDHFEERSEDLDCRPKFSDGIKVDFNESEYEEEDHQLGEPEEDPNSHHHPNNH